MSKYTKFYGIYSDEDDVCPIITIWASTAYEAYDIFLSHPKSENFKNWYVELVSVHKQMVGD